MELSALLAYWRNSLADSTLRAPRVPSNPDFLPTHENVRTGHLDDDLTGRIFRAAEARKVSSKKGLEASANGGPEPTRLEHVRVLIAPFGLRPVVEHQQIRRWTADRGPWAPLWLAGVVDRSGRLTGDEARAPWLVRDHLAPAGRASFVVGALEAYDRFVGRSRGPSEPERWSSHRAYAERLMEAVFGRVDWRGDGFEDTVSLPPVLLLADTLATGINASLLGLYDHLRDKGSPASRLLRRVADPTPDDVPSKDVAPRRQAPPGQKAAHVAARFGLQPSQRRALNAALSLDAGDILAVNGPPGTGKTTLIQSVVASRWVAAALAGGDPPVIHACASTNQAMTNILDAFARVEGDTGPGEADPFSRRWLPDTTGYGVVYPSRGYDEMARRYMVASKTYPGWKGVAGFEVDRRRVATAAAHYRGCAEDALAMASTLPETIEHLHRCLTEVAAEVDSVVGGAARYAHARAAHDASDHESLIEYLAGTVAAADDAIACWQAVSQELDGILEAVPFFEDLLAFLPPIRARRDHPIRTMLRRRAGSAPASLPVLGYRAAARRLVDEPLERWRAERARRAAQQSELEAHAEVIAKLASSVGAERESVLADEAAFEQLLDRTLRRRLFHVAARYWEGRWLACVQALPDSDQQCQRREGRERFFRRLAMLAPISVSTFHQVPKIFDYDDGDGARRPLGGVFDLLIVDEAGQTVPEVGATALHFAQRALVVGDEHQLPPIWGVSPALDTANAEEAGLSLEGPGAEAYRVSAGSLMRLAQHHSRFTDGADTDRGGDGLWLTEHFRCRPGIIAYCNALCYGRLEAKRRELEAPALTPFAWAHVDSPARRRGGSWTNEGQAVAIADWLEQRSATLPPPSEIGVLTPFRAQVSVLRAALDNRGLTDVVAGSVHTFQGGEKAVMIFSPVYDGDHPGNYFFDQGAHMLNVAVSRAKDAFVVFGDMAVFRPTSGAGAQAVPSRLLADFLFADPAHELTDVVATPTRVGRGRVERIASLTKHRAHLHRAFDHALERILVVSPYLTPTAIVAEDMPQRIADACARGVRVVVAYCRDLCTRSDLGQSKALLQDAGAEVWALDRVHNKTLAVDAAWIAEGSFNWLSALRDPDSRYHRAEASMVFHGDDAPAMIADAWAKVETRHAVT